MNNYEILGVAETATLDEVKSAYRKLALEWHPDRHQKDKEVAEKKFKEINEAYKAILEMRKPGNDNVLEVSLREISLGKLAWNEVQEVELKVHANVDAPMFLKSPDLLGGAEILIDWSTRFSANTYDSTKPIPHWTSEIVIKMISDVDCQTFIQIRAYDAIAGNNSSSLIVAVADRNGAILSKRVLPVKFVAAKAPSMFVVLEKKSAISIGPLEVGQTLRVIETVVNIGAPLLEAPTIQWTGLKPQWVSDIRVINEEGRIFPFDISFDVKTDGMTPSKTPYKAGISLMIGKQVVGAIPVVLRVTKVPVPEIVVSPLLINLGKLEWYEGQEVNLKISNNGDPLKAPLTCTVEYSGWLSLIEISPNDKSTFPQRVVLRAHANNLSAGDYVSIVTISEASKVHTVKVFARIGARPRFSVSPQNLHRTISRGQYIEDELIFQNTGGYIPEVKVQWERDDLYAKDPLILDDDFPARVTISADFRGYRETTYHNRLIVSLQYENGNEFQKISIPYTVEFS